MLCDDAFAIYQSSLKSHPLTFSQLPLLDRTISVMGFAFPILAIALYVLCYVLNSWTMLMFIGNICLAIGCVLLIISNKRLDRFSELIERSNQSLEDMDRMYEWLNSIGCDCSNKLSQMIIGLEMQNEAESHKHDNKLNGYYKILSIIVGAISVVVISGFANNGDMVSTIVSAIFIILALTVFNYYYMRKRDTEYHLIEMRRDCIAELSIISDWYYSKESSSSIETARHIRKN